MNAFGGGGGGGGGGLYIVKLNICVPSFQMTTPCFVNNQGRTKTEYYCKTLLESFLSLTGPHGPVGISPPQQQQLNRQQQQQLNRQQQQHKDQEDGKSRAPRIALTHIPLSSAFNGHSSHLKQQVLDAGFDYIISGHIHHENYTSHLVLGDAVNAEGGRAHQTVRLAHEITVPTCSYRMGVAYPGVGAMVIGKEWN